jgi:hypothetical protein
MQLLPLQCSCLLLRVWKKLMFFDTSIIQKKPRMNA